MLDFNRIKEIKLTDVLARYKIALRYKTDYAICACPLPTHKQGDNSKSFSINLTGNYWRCFSDSCNANNGGKRGGNVINFVALMEGCREKDAARKLADWYGVQETKPPLT
jgi:DNA primase